VQSDVTQLLSQAAGDARASARLFELVYTDLRAIASAHMRNEREAHTLQPTALVSEAFVRLVGGTPIDFADRRHFFRVASEAMRRILIDHARARLADKRGGAARRVALSDEPAHDALEPETLVALDEALERFSSEDPRAAEIVRLRFFGGLTLEQAADLLEVSRRTAIRDWNFARARLSELMNPP
jgi:RNA polymerase sigma factor (TIGR02999 family)